MDVKVKKTSEQNICLHNLETVLYKKLSNVKKDVSIMVMPSKKSGYITISMFVYNDIKKNLYYDVYDLNISKSIDFSTEENMKNLIDILKFYINNTNKEFKMHGEIKSNKKE